MASLIGKVCQDLDCHLVLDVGSGLGYLDQVLHHSFNLKCIGLDSSLKYTMAAKDRIKNGKIRSMFLISQIFYSFWVKDSCQNSMHHRTLEVSHSEKCLKYIKSLLNEEHNWKCSCNCNKKTAGSAAMVGLHSCGNLTQDMMKLFCQLDELVALVCVGCCYNKINLLDFPMSKTAQGALKDTCIKFPEWRPCISGLRVAAHGTRSHSVNALTDSRTSKCVFYRALMEYYIKKENITWQQPKRHIRKADLLDFETYCRSMLSSHPLSNDETTLKNLNNLFDEKLHLFSRVKILLVLQLLLQPLWEGFITVDRILYFREKSMSANVLALWDDAKSSRNLALCVYKR
ncbi:unnamed protein product [Larinioides sclopetarius]|uniref:Methyltransferase domain-containing protein n=2 Tax=Larinioides sclopetarius TaxID=280406 RepID=A0AAV2AL89_9ARAC